MKRQITLDTETTGLNPDAGHRIVEIGCVELVNMVPTGRSFQRYINPQRDMPKEAFDVHGLSFQFLSQFPTFDRIYKEFYDFIGDDAEIIIHNAPFDLKFLDHHLAQVQHKTIDRARVIDTIPIARRKFPGSKANLDALCKRFNINRFERTKHGALLDAEILADVYLHLMGGRQPGLDFNRVENPILINEGKNSKPIRAIREFKINEDELNQHQLFIRKIKDALWLRS